jgi:hypothetical protein
MHRNKRHCYSITSSAMASRVGGTSRRAAAGRIISLGNPAVSAFPERGGHLVAGKDLAYPTGENAAIEHKGQFPGLPNHPSPAVYRFICPDGRSYVGAVGDCRKRGGIQRSNVRLLAAFELHPPKTWTYEVLERLTPGCSTEALREAEQHHIDRLRSRLPEFGFIMAPATGVTWTVNGAQRADGIPPHTSFSLAALPDTAHLTEAEVAAVARLSTNTVAAWRQNPDHPLPWFRVAGRYIRYRAGDLKTYMTGVLRQKRVRSPPKRNGLPARSPAAG